MSRIDLVKETRIERSPRVQQIEGMFDLDSTKSSRFELSVQLALDERSWLIGLIVGASASGKTTLLEKLYGTRKKSPWHRTRAIVDCFPQSISIRTITQTLSSVGLSSPPSWLKPYHALSNGEQFRATIARALCASESPAIIDEFTSVVDRNVAKITSLAVSKYVRRSQRSLVLASCHYDVISWLQPDWILDLTAQRFDWGCLQRRHKLALTIHRCQADLWGLFRRHHYLSGSLNRSAKCFVACLERQPVAFASAIWFPHPKRSGWREHRTVCLPDYQGAGIGVALSDYVASLFAAGGRPYWSLTSHPAMIAHRQRSANWIMIRPLSRVAAPGAHSTVRARSMWRYTASFQWKGIVRKREAKRFGVL